MKNNKVIYVSGFRQAKSSKNKMVATEFQNNRKSVQIRKIFLLLVFLLR